MPSQDGSWAISAVHWVTASTKARSKNSSRGLTVSPWRSTTPTRGRFAVARLTNSFSSVGAAIVPGSPPPWGVGYGKKTRRMAVGSGTGMSPVAPNWVDEPPRTYQTPVDGRNTAMSVLVVRA